MIHMAAAAAAADGSYAGDDGRYASYVYCAFYVSYLVKRTQMRLNKQET